MLLLAFEQSICILNLLMLCYILFYSNVRNYYFICLFYIFLLLLILSTLVGTKKLCLPRTSTLFKWDAQQVLSVCSRDSLYILADIEPLKNPFGEISEQEVLITFSYYFLTCTVIQVIL